MKLTLIFVLALACLAGGELTGPMSQEQNPAIREAKPEEIPFAYDAVVFATVEIEQVRKTVFEQDLNRFSEESFTPSLKTLKSLIASIKTN